MILLKATATDYIIITAVEAGSGATYIVHACQESLLLDTKVGLH